jgi:hypothetical protein
MGAVFLMLKIAKWMALILPVSATAAYFGNPAQSWLQTDGLWQTPPSWYCLRAGFMGDHIYRQRYHEEFHIAGTPTPSSYATFWTDAATITLDFKNWLDFTAILGSSQLQIDREIYTKRQFAWGIGAKFLIYHTSSVFVGLDFKYFESEQKPIYLVSSGYAYNVLSPFRLNYCEEQAALGIAYKIQQICPYLQASYLFSKIEPQHPSIIIQMPTYDGVTQTESASVISGRRWGMAFGATIIGGSKGSVAIESRFFNQNALNISGEVRF